VGLGAPEDVNLDGEVSPADALSIINHLNGYESMAAHRLDVNNDRHVSPIDALWVINYLNRRIMPAELKPLRESADAETPSAGGAAFSSVSSSPCGTNSKLLTACEVEQLLDRASAALASADAIIAVVDRGGRILGVRVEEEVQARFAGDDERLVFAIDGAVAKARTAAFFSNDAAPLTSRTIRFISQSTVTQREVESNPNLHAPGDAERLGPGFVAPVGVGGHFPPEIPFTPLVDLFAIEHQSRDSQIHPGQDNRKGTADDITLTNRFNSSHLAPGVTLEFPESYGFASNRMKHAQARGIGTLPGGIPLFRFTCDAQPKSLIGGIGVFFPGDDGYATFEQNFVHKDDRRRRGLPRQTEAERMNAEKALEAEWIAFAATGGVTDCNSSSPSQIGPLGGVPPVWKMTSASVLAIDVGTLLHLRRSRRASPSTKTEAEVVFRGRFRSFSPRNLLLRPVAQLFREQKTTIASSNWNWND
jgi:hypothetical protein